MVVGTLQWPAEPTGDGDRVQYHRYAAGAWRDVDCDITPFGAVCQTSL